MRKMTPDELLAEETHAVIRNVGGKFSKFCGAFSDAEDAEGYRDYAKGLAVDAPTWDYEVVEIARQRNRKERTCGT